MELIFNILTLHLVILSLFIISVRPQDNGNACNGKDYVCVDDNSYLICIDFGDGDTQTVDEVPMSCPRGTYCDNNGVFECDSSVPPEHPQKTSTQVITDTTTGIIILADLTTELIPASEPQTTTDFNSNHVSEIENETTISNENNENTHETEAVTESHQETTMEAQTTPAVSVIEDEITNISNNEDSTTTIAAPLKDEEATPELEDVTETSTSESQQVTTTLAPPNLENEATTLSNENTELNVAQETNPAPTISGIESATTSNENTEASPTPLDSESHQETTTPAPPNSEVEATTLSNENSEKSTSAPSEEGETTTLLDEATEPQQETSPESQVEGETSTESDDLKESTTSPAELEEEQITTISSTPSENVDETTILETQTLSSNEPDTTPESSELQSSSTEEDIEAESSEVVTSTTIHEPGLNPELNSSEESAETQSSTENTVPLTPGPQTFTCRQSGKFAHPTECQKYYFCLWLPFGMFRIEQTCMFGFAFDPIQQRCTSDRTSCNPQEFRCTSPGRFANPQDNTKYYWCIWNVLGGFIQYSISCQNDMLYSPITKSCRHPIDDNLFEIPEMDTTIIAQEHGLEPVEKVKFECLGEGTYPDPENCSKYIVCTIKKKDKYKKSKLKCPKDEKFDVITGLCSAEMDVVCA